MSSKFTEIEELMTDYFNMLYYCDLDLFDRIFHPNAIYATADETPTLLRNMQEYRPILAKREPPSARNENRRDLIDQIQFAGDKTAFAKVRCTIAQRDFIDYLTLIKVDGSWQIISKIFHFTIREND